MRYLKSFVLLITISLSGKGFAQGTLSINSFFNVYSHDTIAFTQNMTFNVVLSNTSPANSFNGNITFVVGVDTMNTNGNISGNIDSLFSTPYSGIILQPGDSINYGDSLFISPNSFKGGINTVVIWPVADIGTGFVTTDSAKHNVYVTQLTGLRSNTMKHPIVVGPNPFSEKILLIFDSKNPIEEVRFFNPMGQEVFVNSPGKENVIDTSELSSGVYFIHLKYKDGNTGIIKTIKE